MTLVLSSDNGYKGPETQIKRDPENRVPLIAKLSGVPGGHVFRERSNAIRIRATLQGIFAVDAKQTPALHAISKPLQRLERPIAPDDCGHSVEMSQVVPSYGLKLFR